MNRVSLQPKPAEVLDERVFDFISNLAEGETLASAALSVSVFSGVDPAPEDILSGSPVVEGTRVTQKFTGGVLGTTYRVLCMAGTCNDQQISLAAYLAIVEGDSV